jgi:hypothetical protein
MKIFVLVCALYYNNPCMTLTYDALSSYQCNMQEIVCQQKVRSFPSVDALLKVYEENKGCTAYEVTGDTAKELTIIPIYRYETKKRQVEETKKILEKYEVH